MAERGHVSSGRNAPEQAEAALPPSQGELPAWAGTAGLVAALVLLARGGPLLRRALPETPNPRSGQTSLGQALLWFAGTAAAAAAARRVASATEPQAAGGSQAPARQPQQAAPRRAARRQDDKTSNPVSTANRGDRTGPEDRARARQDDRGRHATTPSEIPARGWKDIFWRTLSEISEDRILMVAAGVTFYVLLAIFPAITALISLYGFFADPSAIQSKLDSLSSVLPGGAIEVIGGQMKRVASQGGGSLTIGFVLGLLIALWSANSGTTSLFDALNIAYDEKEKRGYVRLYATAFAFTLGGLAFLILAIAVVAVVPILLNFVGLGSIAGTLIAILRWPLVLVVVGIGIALIYRFGPSREKAKWRWITWGSAFASVVWLGGSLLFSWYVANFGSYNATYGSLGAAIGFMTWIWLSATVILIGAEIDSEMEHQTAEDTTTGPTKPLGERGATQADTVGKAVA